MTRAYIWLFVGLLLLVIPAKIWIHFATMDTVSGVVVQDKERIVTGTGAAQESKYLIFTDRETFENTDSWLAMKFNSSDLYGSIKEGSTCDLSVTGLRVPILSWYRNILSATCN